jgi:hypothetical protein
MDWLKVTALRSNTSTAKQNSKKPCSTGKKRINTMLHLHSLGLTAERLPYGQCPQCVLHMLSEPNARLHFTATTDTKATVQAALMLNFFFRCITKCPTTKGISSQQQSATMMHGRKLRHRVPHGAQGCWAKSISLAVEPMTPAL